MNVTTAKRSRPKMGSRLLRPTHERIILWIISFFLAIYALSLIYPFFYLLINSFKTNTEILLHPFSFASAPSFDSYHYVFEHYGIGEMFLNSLLLTVGETAASMFFTVCAAYVLAKYEFPGNHFLYNLVLICGMIPTIASLPSTYKLMAGSHLMGTYIGMILLNCGAFGGSFLYLHSYFRGIPWDYAESAQIDGADDFTIFVRIMCPLAKNSIITFTIIRFLGFWNDYWFPSLFYSNHPVLAVGLANLSSEAANGFYSEYFAAMIIAVIPVLIFYAIFQKPLMTNTIEGGLKQ